MSYSRLRGVSLLTALLGLSACTTAQPVGSGWARAPDLSVWSAMGVAREIAVEQEVLCFGRNPALVEARWRAAYGAREDWIEGAMVRRYGLPALVRAETDPIGREPCERVRGNRWRDHYARLLRVLELRLYPRESWRTG